MLFSLEYARDLLRVDGDANDPVIEPLIEALPGYIEVLTGCTYSEQQNNPIAQTLGAFLLQMWYNPENQDADKVQRVIDNLAKALKAQRA